MNNLQKRAAGRTNDRYIFRGETDSESWQLRIFNPMAPYAVLWNDWPQAGKRLSIDEFRDLVALMNAGLAAIDEAPE